MVRAPSRARIHRSRRSGTTAPVDRVYHQGLTVGRGDEWGMATVARCAGGIWRPPSLASRIAAPTAPTRPGFRCVAGNPIPAPVPAPEPGRRSVRTPVPTRPTPVFRPKGSAMSNLDLLAAPAVVRVLVAAGGYTIGSGRTVPTVAAVLGLISVVIGGLALARSAGRIGVGTGRVGALVTLALGLITVIVGGLHAANSAGGLGTGNGLAGAVVALVLGLIGMVLGGLALARSRRRVHARLRVHRLTKSLW